jgi:hypothetical protein
MNSHHQRIRDVLTGTDGLTAKQIEIALQIDTRVVRKSLQTMVDVYADRWTRPYRGQWVAVYCAVEVPADCPHPTKESKWTSSH